MKCILPGTIVYDVTVGRVVGRSTWIQIPVALFSEKPNAERFIADQDNPARYRITERPVDEVPANAAALAKYTTPIP